jgi:hypothetical protein
MEFVGMVVRFQSAHKESHLKAVKQIFRYLKANSDFGLLYPKKKDFQLNAYIDADWDGSVDDRKEPVEENFL